MKQKHSNRLCSIIVSIIVVLIVLIAVSLFWVNSRLCFVDYTPYSYSESGDAIKNPYVGLYSIRGYLLAEDATFSLPETNAAIDSASSSFELSPVSYTHLDVYKRQDIYIPRLHVTSADVSPAQKCCKSPRPIVSNQNTLFNA